MEKIKESMKDNSDRRKNYKSLNKNWERPLRRQKLVSTGNRRNIKFLVENTEINMGKTSDSNAGMDRRSKKSTKMANTKKNGAYTQD